MILTMMKSVKRLLMQLSKEKKKHFLGSVLFLKSYGTEVMTLRKKQLSLALVNVYVLKLAKIPFLTKESKKGELLCSLFLFLYLHINKDNPFLPYNLRHSMVK